MLLVSFDESNPFTSLKGLQCNLMNIFPRKDIQFLRKMLFIMSRKKEKRKKYCNSESILRDSVPTFIPSNSCFLLLKWRLVLVVIMSPISTNPTHHHHKISAQMRSSPKSVLLDNSNKILKLNVKLIKTFNGINVSCQMCHSNQFPTKNFVDVKEKKKIQ